MCRAEKKSIYSDQQKPELILIYTTFKSGHICVNLDKNSLSSARFSFAGFKGIKD